MTTDLLLQNPALRQGLQDKLVLGAWTCLESVAIACHLQGLVTIKQPKEAHFGVCRGDESSEMLWEA